MASSTETGAAIATKVLVVDDDAELLRAMERTLKGLGHKVLTAGDAESGLQLAREQAPTLVIADLILPGMDGVELLREIKSQSPNTEVLLITAHASVEKVVEAMRLGAYDFIEKPVDRQLFQHTVNRALEKHTLSAENLRLRERLGEQEGVARLVGTSGAISQVKSYLAQVGPTDMPVLVLGESGTGKEVVADILHALSPRRRGPLVKISCAAIPENLLESELFGYEKGAFSGAGQSKPGRFEIADGGTLFLDEIGEMAPMMQAKLLRILQDGRIQRLGSTKDIQVDVRVISATNVDVGKAIREGRFRADLYHRLNLIEIRMPPLRERVEDIPLLAGHFLAQYGKNRSEPPIEIDADAMDKLTSYSWPGNVRELENVIQRAVALARGRSVTSDLIRLDRAAARLTGPTAGSGAEESAPAVDTIPVPAGTPLSQVERVVIEDALRRCNGNREKAARMLGISSRTLYRRVQTFEAEARNGQSD